MTKFRAFINEDEKKALKVMKNTLAAINKKEAGEVIVYMTDQGDKFKVPFYEGENAFDIPKVIKNAIKNKAFPWALGDNGYGKFIPISSDEFPFSDIDDIYVDIYFDDGTETTIK